MNEELNERKKKRAFIIIFILNKISQKEQVKNEETERFWLSIFGSIPEVTKKIEKENLPEDKRGTVRGRGGNNHQKSLLQHPRADCGQTVQMHLKQRDPAREGSTGSTLRDVKCSTGVVAHWEC